MSARYQANWRKPDNSSTSRSVQVCLKTKQQAAPVGIQAYRLANEPQLPLSPARVLRSQVR